MSARSQPIFGEIFTRIALPHRKSYSAVRFCRYSLSKTFLACRKTSPSLIYFPGTPLGYGEGPLAEQAGETRPDGMQRLLSNAVWDEDGVRDELRKSVLERLGAEHAIAAIDETSFPKRGDRSAGVAPHSCGSTKPVENCQVGVFLSYISPLGHTLLDRELYLPRHWVEDRARCEEASIPETVRFQTKCELARRMVDSSFSQCKSRAGLVMVASMPTSQSRRLSCQAPPQLQLVVCHARSSKTKRGLEVRVAARGLARQKCNAVCSRVLVASTPSLDVSLSSLQSP